MSRSAMLFQSEKPSQPVAEQFHPIIGPVDAYLVKPAVISDISIDDAWREVLPPCSVIEA